MITKGQARRIASYWQAGNNGCSWLQHKGVITEGLVQELDENAQAVYRLPEEERDLSWRELRALKVFALHFGVGKVPGWGAWDDKPVHA